MSTVQTTHQCDGRHQEDAAVLVSVFESSGAGGKLSARVVRSAGQAAGSSIAGSPCVNGCTAVLGHTSPSAGAVRSSNMLQVDAHAPVKQPALSRQQRQTQRGLGVLQLPASADTEVQKHGVPECSQGTSCPAPVHTMCTAHGGLKHDTSQSKQQHVTWDPAAVFLPGTIEPAAADCSSECSTVWSSPAGSREQADLFQLFEIDRDRDDEQHLLMQLPMHSRSSGAGMRVSSSCGSLNMLEGQTGSNSFGITAATVKSRLGRVTSSTARTGEYELAADAAAAATPNALPADVEGLVTSWLAHEPAYGMRSVAGGVGDEHSGAGHWHSSNWALERSASNCSFGTDDGAARKLHIHCVTFNMGSKVPSFLPAGLLGPPDASSNGLHAPSAAPEGNVDLYVFSTQESGSISDWERLIASSLPSGVGYERLAWQTLRAMHLVLYASPRFRKQVLGVKGSAVATGVGNLVGNKGAVALAIQLLDLKLLFVGSHFAAHDDKVDRRNADFARIRAGLFSSSSYSSLTELAGRSSSMSGGSSQHSNTTSPAVFGSLLRTVPCSGSNSGAFTPQDEVHGEDQQQQVSCSLRATRASSKSSSRGWFSGLWNRCRTPTNTTKSCSGSQGERAFLEAGMCSSSSIFNQDAALNAACELPTLRATSCPSLPRGVPSGKELSATKIVCQAQQQAAECQQQHFRALEPFPFQAGAGQCSSSIQAQENMRDPSEAAGFPVGPAAGSTSLADEIRNQFSFFKSFNLRRPTRDLLTRATRDLNNCGDVTADYDVVFWVGDLNYRINGNTKAIGYLLHSKLYEVLHANDQLRLQQKKGRVFQGFQEGKIHFPPTFKYLPGTCDYSQHRVPSWTDRILWKVRQREPWEDGAAPTVVQNYYKSVKEVLSSDHKPVVAGFDLVIAAAEAPSPQAESGGLRSRCSIM